MTTAQHDAALVDLAEIRAVCAAVVDWFDAHAAGTQPPIEALDRAVTRAKTLPHLPGAFGRALAAIAAGGRGCDRRDIVDALDQLRRAAMFAQPRASADPQPRGLPVPGARRRSSRRSTAGQLTLPLTEVAR